MLARLDPRFLDRIWFPLGEQTKEQTRGEAQAAGLAAAERAESQEACFLAGDDYRAFLGRQGLGQRAARSSTSRARRSGAHDGFWRYTPGQRRGLGVAAAEPLYAIRDRAADEHRRRRAARRRSRAGGCRPRAALRAGRPGQREAPLPLAGRRRDRRGDRPGLPAAPRRAGVRRGPRPGRRALRRRCRRRSGLITSAADDLV